MDVIASLETSTRICTIWCSSQKMATSITADMRSSNPAQEFYGSSMGSQGSSVGIVTGCELDGVWAAV
jgi:hypothetical protein